MKLILFLAIFCHAFSAYAGPTKFSLERLGMTFDEEKVTDEEAEVLYEDRAYHLEQHEKWGKRTFFMALLTAAAGIYGTSKIDRKYSHLGEDYEGPYAKSDVKYLYPHFALALTTEIFYWTTAYHAIKAPKPNHMEYERERIWHKSFAYIHLSSMTIGPILGAITINRYVSGKKPGTIADIHRAVMYTGATALTGAYISMTFDFD